MSITVHALHTVMGVPRERLRVHARDVGGGFGIRTDAYPEYIALLRRTEVADTGDIVVALIDEEEATLKRFRRRGASIALEPANSSHEVRILPPNRVKIQGKLVGLFRRY